MIKGYVNSIQSLGTVDGPGVRFVAFLQGCNLRCSCCHNPDTWDVNGGTAYTPEELVTKALRCKEYFGREGGLTLSGGEPLLQSEFAYEVFRLCHQAGINTCLDTSGSVLDDKAKKLLSETDRVLLDVKYTNDEDYEKYVGCTTREPLDFLKYLNEQGIPTTLRQVIIPTLNDTEDNVLKLREIAKSYPCVDKIELLPFRKICKVKYDKLNLAFPLEHLPEPTEEQMKKLNELLTDVC